jgi:hypothetical protein
VIDHRIYRPLISLMRSAGLLCRCLAALKSQTIFWSQQEISIVVNDNRITLSIADIRMRAAGLVGLAVDSCPTHRFPSDPANPKSLFPSWTLAKRCIRIEDRASRRHRTGSASNRHPAGDSDLDHRLPSDPQADRRLHFVGAKFIAMVLKIRPAWPDTNRQDLEM